MRRTAFTARAAVLALVVAALAFTLAYPARQFYRQRQQIAALQGQIGDSHRSIADLQRLKAQWADPAHVEAQARERLLYVRPGEPAYIVLRAQPRAEQLSGPLTVLPSQSTESTWYERLWATTQQAGAAAAPAGEVTASPTASPPAVFVPKKMPKTVSSGGPGGYPSQGPPPVPTPK